MGVGLAIAVDHRDTAASHDLTHRPTTATTKDEVEVPEPDRSTDYVRTRVTNSHPENQSPRISVGGSGFSGGWGCCGTARPGRDAAARSGRRRHR